ncbi:MAG TPA: hypothetical protein PK939_01065 [Bacteroidales bacterium]|nr:hypothetical protein [Bacteroidales bacterium]HQQ12378.1 hypothetical protein [Bacteroidales bacterium]
MTLPYFLNRSICQLAADARKIKLRPFGEVRTLLVLVSTNDQDTIHHYHWLQNSFPEINLLAFIQFSQEKKPDYRFHNGVLKISKKSFNFFGKPVAALQNVVRNQSFDLLINADQNDLLYNHVIAACANAELKVGSPMSHCKHLYPVSIYSQTATEFQDYITQCRSYLDALSGKH